MTLDLLEQLRADLEEVIARSRDGTNVPPAQLRALLQPLLSWMNLIDRGEFDTQVRFLHLAREKMADLEARLSELEKSATED